MADYLSGLQSSIGPSSNECIQRVGELLRVLIHVSHPFRSSPAELLTVESGVLKAFIGAIDGGFRKIEIHLQNGTLASASTDNFILLSRLLQFALSFKHSWTPEAKDTCVSLLTLLFRFALVRQLAQSQYHIPLTQYIDSILQPKITLV